MDDTQYRGLPPHTSYVTRTIFVHTLAFNDPLKGVKPEHLRFSVLGPGLDISFIEDARKRFIAESAYLDDRQGAPMRFLAEANLNQIVRRQEQDVDPGEVRTQLNDSIREIFKSKTFDQVAFPGGAYEVPDEVGNAPLLVVLGYDAASVGAQLDTLPELVRRIYKHKGAEDKTRLYRNHLVFVVADEQRKEDMRRKMVRRLALHELKRPERLSELAEHQQQKVREMEAKSEQEAALAIQQCYRHVFYPSAAKLEGTDVELAHTAVEIQSASANPGSGQLQVMRALRDNNKLRTGEDEPDSPAYIRDRTPLKKGQITTASLRDEFRRDPKLPILIGDAHQHFVRFQDFYALQQAAVPHAPSWSVTGEGTAQPGNSAVALDQERIRPGAETSKDVAPAAGRFGGGKPVFHVCMVQNRVLRARGACMQRARPVGAPPVLVRRGMVSSRNAWCAVTCALTSAPRVGTAPTLAPLGCTTTRCSAADRGADFPRHADQPGRVRGIDLFASDSPRRQMQLRGAGA